MEAEAEAEAPERIMGLPSMTVVLPAMAAGCGVLSHLAYFIRGEHHKQAILFFKLVVLLPSTVCVVLMHFFSLTLRHAAWLSGSITAAYLGALWTSMIIYRSFFHRLHHFPGPPLAKVSKFYHFFGVLHQAPYRTLEGWHQKYGRIVRIGKRVSGSGGLDFPVLAFWICVRFIRSIRFIRFRWFRWFRWFRIALW